MARSSSATSAARSCASCAAEIGTLAVELAEKILDQRLADDAQVRATVDSFIAALDAAERAQAGSQS